MKKYLLILYLLCCSFGASAQVEIPFDVEVTGPLSIATSTVSDGINIRQNPSANAPRLMVDESKIDNYETPWKYFGFWSSNPASGYIHPITFYGPGLVIDQQNGWLKIRGIGKNGSDGWVSAKYCKVQEPQPITTSLLHNCELYVPINGDYGMVVTTGMDEIGTVHIGKMVNGIFVCPYYVEFSIITGASKEAFKSNGIGSGSGRYSTTIEDYYFFDENFSAKNLNKFTADILKAAKPLSSPEIFYNQGGTLTQLNL